MKLDKFITLGADCQVRTNLDGWYLSEKMDGCRAIWDGSNLWSRGGKIISLPASIRTALPAGHRLDGEVWAGRERFTEARLAVQYGRWTRRCRFVAFDAPDATGTWQERVAEAGRRYGDVVSFNVCESWRHANALLFEVQAICGEGLVARHPTARGYEHGRTDNFLKVKEPLL
ncbi:MAG: hypothetical protein PHY43_14795 [Verrucomicrobiales bacterium]|nr:hypothetical protein [Verrucomicrobiales bacterium]